MQTDRTTKSLLFLIAVALWGILIKSAFEPKPTIAQGLANPVKIAGVEGSLPVTVVRQSAPFEVKVPRGERFIVELNK